MSMIAPVENRAVRLPQFGHAEVLQIDSVAVPRPCDDEVLVRVCAASVNPVDFKTREGMFQPVGKDSLPITLGRDLAGRIEAVGAHAPDMLMEGQPVFAFIGTDRGAQSDYVILKASELAPMPDGLDMVHAAAVPLAALTAWQGLFDHGGLTAGQSVLVHGGAGGVGHFAIQLAKAKGASVYATCSGADCDFVREMGADVAIDYRTQRFEAVAHEVDMVFDLVGGNTQERSWAVLKEGGILVSTLQEPDPEIARAHKVRTAPRYMAAPDAGQLRAIAELIAAGKVRVVVSETYPLERVEQAQERLEQGHLRGKIVLTLGGDG